MKYLLGLLMIGNAACATTSDRIILNRKNTVVLRGVIDDGSVIDTQYKLMSLVAARGSRDYPIYLVLDSPGGSIDAGFSLIEYAKSIDNLKTVSIFAASMASAVAEALPGERLVTQHGIMMFHRAAGTFSGYFETGEVESRLWLAKSMVIELESSNASRMRMDLGQYKNLVSTELWLFGSNNKLYRAADKIVTLECTKDLIDQTESMAINDLMSMLFGGGPRSITFSSCPLFRSPKGGEAAKYLVPSVQNYHSIQLFEQRTGNKNARTGN